MHGERTRSVGISVILSRMLERGTAVMELSRFRVVGTYRRHGKLDSAWRDCAIVERTLDEG